MERQTRSERIYNDLLNFKDNNSQTSRQMTLYKGEVAKAKRYICEMNVPIQITSIKEIKKGEVLVKFEKIL